MSRRDVNTADMSGDSKDKDSNEEEVKLLYYLLELIKLYLTFKMGGIDDPR